MEERTGGSTDEMDADADRPVEENEAPPPTEPPEEAPGETGQEEPRVAGEFTATMERLADRGRAAAGRPFRQMLATYIRQGMAVIDGILESLDEGNRKRKG